MKRRFSVQKKMIKDVLDILDHPTATQVYEEIKKDYPQISLGTVYRNLGAMSEDGEVIRLSFSNEPDRFDINTYEHFHALCKTCGDIFDTDNKLPNNLLKQLDEAVECSTGICVESRSMLFSGVCVKCKEKNMIN